MKITPIRSHLRDISEPAYSAESCHCFVAVNWARRWNYQLLNPIQLSPTGRWRVEMVTATFLVVVRDAVTDIVSPLEQYCNGTRLAVISWTTTSRIRLTRYDMHECGRWLHVLVTRLHCSDFTDRRLRYSTSRTHTVISSGSSSNLLLTQISRWMQFSLYQDVNNVVFHVWQSHAFSLFSYITPCIRK